MVLFALRYRPVVDEDGTLQQAIGVSLDITEQHQSEQQLQTLMETVPAGVFMASADGELEYLNSRVREMLGLPESDAIGRYIGKILEADRAETFQRHHSEVLEREETVEREQTLHGENGKRVINATVAPVESEAGEGTSIAGVANDVTDRKERERQLQKNDAIFTQLTETTDDVFWLFDGAFSELRFVNEAYEDVWG
jgi:PAS domain S-box-containing protein